jgi:hypothetical protein
MVNRCTGVLAVACLGLACGRGPEPPATVHLVDLFDAQKIEAAATALPRAHPRGPPGGRRRPRRPSRPRAGSRPARE